MYVDEALLRPTPEHDLCGDRFDICTMTLSDFWGMLLVRRYLLEKGCESVIEGRRSATPFVTVFIETCFFSVR